ncbi:diguanylate cyclase domain-containing protein [Gordonibacter sp.]|uniref:diguanylate cyclase domain-containing protein n=1 Tax=Gordonibacter sp. TaxID=1968902 RepID=UPI002FC5A85B
MAHQHSTTLVRLLMVLVLTCTLIPSSALADTSNGAPETQTAPSAEAQPSSASPSTNSTTVGDTIRVGFVNQPGSFSVDKDGNYAGYEYDYLIQLAQYTGWNYEFIEATGDSENARILKSLDMLENEEVDLLGTMNYNSKLAEVYEYPRNSYGYFHPSLFAADNTTDITKTNLYTLEELTVAIKRTSVTYRTVLENFCTKNNIPLTLQEYDSFDEMAAAVNEGRADALLDLDINLHTGFHIVATLQTHPVFFAAKKGRTDITSTIDGAIERLNAGNPLLQSKLYQTYYGVGEEDLSLTPSELAYAADQKPLRVGIVSDKAPIQSFDEKTGELTGVTKDVLDYITSDSGLQFEIVPLKHDKDFAQELHDQNIDLVAGVDNNYTAALEWGLSLSAPYVTSNTLIVFNKNTDPSDLSGHTLAVPRDQVTAASSDGPGPVEIYKSLSDCFEAVDSGRADYVYASTYTAPYYINYGSYTNLNFLPVSISTSQACFGVVAPIEPDLLLILNKSIHSIPESTLSSMIYEASLPSEEERFGQIVKTHLTEIFVASVALLLIVITLLALYLRTRSKAARNARDENNRHREIYRISNEQFFEYTPKTDTLLLSVPEKQQFAHLHRSSSKVSSNYSPYHTYEHISTQHYEFLPIELVEAITAPKNPVADVCCSSEDGRKYWIRISSSILTDDGGKPLSIIGKMTDINEEILEKTHLSERAKHDGLTGLLNRSTFEEEVKHVIAKGKTGAFLIIDVDHFKDVNDTHGHMVGDAALRSMAGLLRNSFHSSDLVGRFGGDEFSVYIFSPIDRKTLEDRCRALVSEGVSYREKDGTEYHATLSMGVFLTSRPIDDYDYLYALADKALYEAKRNGRNQFVIHEQ